MGEKSATLSIVIRTVDQATAKLKAINERLDAVTKPVRDFKKQLGEFAEKSGLTSVAEGFKGVGEAAKETLFKIAELGLVVGEAVHLVLELVDHFDELGKKAERLGVGVDFLAGLGGAAERSGASVEQLQEGMDAFSQSLGQARAGTGRMAAFLTKVNPAFLQQLKSAKSNEEAFNDLADAMSKVKDPAERAALASKTVGDAALAPLLARGSKGIKTLTDAYTAHTGSLKGAVEASTETHEAMLRLKESTEGVKAALVEGLAPALTIIIKQIDEWLSGHREDIKEWAEAVGKRLPGAFNVVVGAIGDVIDVIKPFVDNATKLKVVAIALAAVMVGPLLSAFVTLGVAILSTPVGWILAAVAALSVAWYEVIANWDGVKKWLGEFWDYLDEKTHGAIQVLKLVVAPFIAVPYLIYKAWSPIKDFFGALWDGITGVFQGAWDFIAGIVDKIRGAVNTVVEAGQDVSAILSGKSASEVSAEREKSKGEALGDRMYDDMLARKRAAQATAVATGMSGGGTQNAQVTVDFKNAPPGTRVSADPKSTADVDLNVGYQLATGMGW